MDHILIDFENDGCCLSLLCCVDKKGPCRIRFKDLIHFSMASHSLYSNAFFVIANRWRCVVTHSHSVIRDITNTKYVFGTFTLLCSPCWSEHKRESLKVQWSP